jgi:hypothetical protein
MLCFSTRLNLLSRDLGLRCNAREPLLESSLPAFSIGCAQTVYSSYDPPRLITRAYVRYANRKEHRCDIRHRRRDSRC